MVKESRFIVASTLLCCIFQLMLVSSDYSTEIFFLLLISGGLLILNNSRAYLHFKPAIIIAGLLYLIVLMLSPYNHISTIVLWLSLIYSFFFIQRVETIGAPSFFEKILWCFVFIISFATLFWGERFNGDITFNNYDNNYAGVTIFLFFLFAEKRNMFGRKVLFIAILLAGTKSRSYLLLFAVFYFIRLLKKMKLRLPRLDRKRLLVLFVIAIVVILAFSYVWVNVISVGQLLAYRTSLNDLSNRVRFSANIYAWEEVLTNLNFTTLFTGYGGSLKEIMGIPHDDNVLYNGVRLVVPHNMILNTLVSMGWIPGIVFWWFMLCFISKYCTSENYEYIFPFLLNGMFLATNKPGFLILWLLVVALPKQQVHEKSKHKYFISSVEKGQ